MWLDEVPPHGFDSLTTQSPPLALTHDIHFERMTLSLILRTHLVAKHKSF